MDNILELGDLVPERIPVRLNRIVDVNEENGTVSYKTMPVTFQAYKYGPRCPVVVKAALRQILERYAKEMDASFSPELFQVYARDSFLQLIPGISFEEADLLASDDQNAIPDDPDPAKREDGKCIKALKYLGYWRETSTPENPETTDEVEGEVVAEAELQTTQKSSPTSA